MAGESAGLPWWPKERRREPGREPLTRGEIVDAAVRLIDRDGLEALSMRKLAQELGAGVMSLYWYVQNKDELLDFVSDAISGEIVAQLPRTPGPSWRDDVVEFASAVRRTLVDRHPRAALLFSGPTTLGPHAVALMEHLAAVLERTGLEEKKLFMAHWATLNYAYSYAIAGETAKQDVATRGRGNPTRDDLLTGLPVEQYPHLAVVLPSLAKTTAEERFEYGLQRLLDGIEAESVGGDGWQPT